METKQQIRKKALKLFNERGLLNVTLRDVAKGLNKSYGNITYHYKNKAVLIEAIYMDMLNELEGLNKSITSDDESLLAKIILAPLQTFDLTMKYVFLYMDFVEIRRNFEELYLKIDENNKSRMEIWKHTLKELQNQHYIHADLEDEDLFYLMELSGAMRTLFFLKLKSNELNKNDLKSQYVTYINKLFYPYLTQRGKEIYKEVLDPFFKSGVFSEYND